MKSAADILLLIWILSVIAAFLLLRSSQLLRFYT